MNFFGRLAARPSAIIRRRTKTSVKTFGPPSSRVATRTLLFDQQLLIVSHRPSTQRTTTSHLARSLIVDCFVVPQERCPQATPTCYSNSEDFFRCLRSIFKMIHRLLLIVGAAVALALSAEVCVKFLETDSLSPPKIRCGLREVFTASYLHRTFQFFLTMNRFSYVGICAKACLFQASSCFLHHGIVRIAYQRQEAKDQA